MTIDQLIAELQRLKEEGVIQGSTELVLDVWDGDFSTKTVKVSHVESYNKYPLCLKIKAE